MEITISAHADGTATVRTSTGLCVPCVNEHEAVIYSEGLTAGYRAAIAKLDACHGWHKA